MNLQTRIWTKKITRIARDYRRLSSACDSATKAGCLERGGPLFEAIWKSHYELLSQCDFAGWISWFLYENECGEKKLRAKTKREEFQQISTPAQLAKLIVKIQSTQ